MSQPLLSISGLSAISDRDAGAPILRDVSLTLERGEVRGLVGESGAGKSTIAKALLGILPRTVRVTSASSSVPAAAYDDRRCRTPGASCRPWRTTTTSPTASGC